MWLSAKTVDSILSSTIKKYSVEPQVTLRVSGALANFCIGGEDTVALMGCHLDPGIQLWALSLGKAQVRIGVPEDTELVKIMCQ